MKKKRKNILLNKEITYRCEECCHKEKIWVEVGLEDNLFENKIVPQVIKCPICGEEMYRTDYRDEVILQNPIFLTKKMKYFKNSSNNDFAVLQHF